MVQSWFIKKKKKKSQMSQLKAQTCLSLDNELLNNFPPLTSLRAQVPGNLSVSFLMVVVGGVYLSYLSNFLQGVMRRSSWLHLWRALNALVQATHDANTAPPTISTTPTSTAGADALSPYSSTHPPFLPPPVDWRARTHGRTDGRRGS